MTTHFQSHRSVRDDLDLMFFAGAPAVHHCHHFNLFLDQTIDDALGTREGVAVRFRAAREASRQLLTALIEREGATTPAERLALAGEAFAAMGHGRLQILADANGGTATGEFLHYGFSWLEKYGQIVRRTQPADAFASGFAAAAIEVAFDVEPETMEAQETHCIATRDGRCMFTLEPGAPATALPAVGEAECERHSKPADTGKNEQKIAEIAAGLRDFTAGAWGDDRGLLEAFGVYVTLHLPGYYNRISYDACHHVRESSPQILPALIDLLRESGHVCVFNTFGGILSSPEWEGMVGSLQGDVEEIVTGCCAIGRALGFGHWTIADLEPGRRLVLRSTSSYETPFYATRYGTAPFPCEFFFQGAALAIMQLAHRVDWKNGPKFTQELYQELFRGEMHWELEPTSSLACGGDRNEAVVTAKR